MSERRYPVKYKIIDGVRVPYHSRPYEYPSPADNYSTTTNEVSDFEQAVFEVFFTARNVLLKKHEAYGPKNIAQAPGGPENGLRVRMWDKMARLNHILENPGVDVNDESLEDTLMDLLNYCAIFIMVRKNQWPAE